MSSTGHPQVYFYMEFAMHSSTAPGSGSDYLVGGRTDLLFSLVDLIVIIVKVVPVISISGTTTTIEGS